MTESPREEYAAERTRGAADSTHFQPHVDEPTVDRTPVDESVVQERATRAASLPEIKGYELLDVVGRGGMGVVYRARQVGLKRIVALKMILAGGHAGETHLARFRAEAESAARLQHPNIVQVYEVGESGGFPFFSQEFMEGGTLSQRLSGAPQPARPAAELLALLADAIDYAHQKGVVHRDLKPANILLTTNTVRPRDEHSGQSGSQHSTSRSKSSGSNVLSQELAYRFGLPKIGDFGLAKQLDDQSGRTESGAILGTPSYMAPEQADGRTREIGPAADTYALGAILYELLTGRPPFRGESSLETLEQVRTQEPVAPRYLQPKTPTDLETICLKCLRKEQAHRYGSAGDLAADLRAFLEGRPISARRAGVVERGWRWCRRKPWTAAFLAASLFVVLAVFIGAWYRQQFLNSQRVARASDELAQTQEYYSLVNSARELVATAPLGWTWRAAEDLERAAKSPSRVVDKQELRSLAASCLSRFDVRAPTELARGIAPSEIVFNADGSRLSIAENKNAVLLSVHEYDPQTGQRLALRSISTVSSSLEKLVQGTGAYQEGITSLAYSPDKRWLVVGTRFGKLCRWDLSQAEPPPIVWQAFGPRENVKGLVFDESSSELIAGSEGRGLKRWRISTGWQESGLLPDVKNVYDLKLAGNGVLALAAGERLELYPQGAMEPAATQPKDIYARRLSVTADGRFISAKSNSTIRLIETRTGREIRVLELPEEDAQASAAPVHHSNDSQFSPDGALLATSWVDKRVRVWDVASGRIVATIAIPGDSGPLATFSPTGKFLAVAAERDSLLYELREATFQTTVAQQSAAIQSIGFSPDGKSLVTNSDRGYPGVVADNLLAWWDLETGRLQRELLVVGGQGKPPARFASCESGLDVHPQGKLVAASSAMLGTRLVASPLSAPLGSQAKIPTSRTIVEVTESDLERSESSPDVEVRADQRADGGKAIRIQAGAEPREVLAAIPSECRKETASAAGWAVFASIRAEASGSAGAAFDMSIVTANKRDSTRVDLVRLPDDGYHWYLVDQFTDRDLKEHPMLRYAISAPAKSGDLVAVWVDRLMFVPLGVRSWPGDLQIFPQGPVAFAPSGHRLWGILDEGQVVGWNVPELTVATRWDVTSVNMLLGKFKIRTLAAGEKWVLAGSSTGDTFALSSASGKMEESWRNVGRTIRALALDPTENLAAIGVENGGLRVVKVPSGEVVATLAGHREAVESLVFSADGQWLISGSHDRTVRMWQRQEDGFAHLVTLPASGRVRSVRLTRDAKKLAVLVESERAVRIWHLDRLSERFQNMGLGW